MWPSHFAYLLSFVVIGAIWMLFIAFLPFPTAVLAQSFLTNVDESIATARMPTEEPGDPGRE